MKEKISIPKIVSLVLSILMIAAALLISMELQNARIASIPKTTSIFSSLFGREPFFVWSATIEAPTRVSISNSFHVNLTLEPSGPASKIPPNLRQDRTNSVILRGVSFEIDPKDGFSFKRLPNFPYTWTWSVLGKSPGRHELIIDLADFPLVSAYFRSGVYHAYPTIAGLIPDERRQPAELILLNEANGSIVIPVTVVTIWGLTPRAASFLRGIVALIAFGLMCPALISLFKWIKGIISEKK